jgi:flagellar L-ring protein precursor FlgH
MGKVFYIRVATCALWLCGLSCALAADEAESMFDEQNYRSLLAEGKASRIGDVLTVIVQEQATAASTADLKAQRDFSASGQFHMTGFAHIGGVPKDVGGGTASSSDGAGSTERSGSLVAQLTVRVDDVNANGDLVVSGRQTLKINSEEQTILLSGVVRRQDILADNTVLSNRVGNAQIQFIGEGFVTEQSKPGWLARLFAFLGI